MKERSLKTFLSCGLAAVLSMAAFACSDDDGAQEGPPSTAGTGCPELVCDASGMVKSGSKSTGDEYAANAGCTFADFGTCAEGCDATRTLVRLPGCRAGSACNVVARELGDPGAVTSDTSCAAEAFSDSDACGGYPCLSRSLSGMDLKPYFCAIQRCDTDADCPADHFCRCLEEEIAQGAYVAERWCVRRDE